MGRLMSAETSRKEDDMYHIWIPAVLFEGVALREEESQWEQYSTRSLDILLVPELSAPELLPCVPYMGAKSSTRFFIASNYDYDSCHEQRVLASGVLSDSSLFSRVMREITSRSRRGIRFMITPTEAFLCWGKKKIILPCSTSDKFGVWSAVVNPAIAGERKIP